MLDLKGYGWQLAEGLWMTVRAGPVAMLLAILLGLLGAGAKLSPSKPLQRIAGAYTVIVRGIPELVMILLVYFGGTILINALVEALGSAERVDINAFTAGVGVIGFVYGAFATEVFRGAFMAVPKGQAEAAKALGMSRFLIFRRILFPQVMRYAIPGLGNIWLVLLKATALMSVVGLDELTRKAYIAAGATREPFTFYFMAAVYYLALTLVSSILLQYLERRYSRGVRRAA